MKILDYCRTCSNIRMKDDGTVFCNRLQVGIGINSHCEFWELDKRIVDTVNEEFVSVVEREINDIFTKALKEMR